MYRLLATGREWKGTTMLRDANTKLTDTGEQRHRRRLHLGWLTAGALGLAVVGAGAVQAQRYNDDGPEYGESHGGNSDRSGDRSDMRHDRFDRSDRDGDRYERSNRDERRFGRGDRGERFDRGDHADRGDSADRGDRAERRERSGQRHWQGRQHMSRMERLRAYCSGDNERYEPAIRLYIKADLRLNKDQEAAFDQLADAVMPAIADVKKARCDNLDATAKPTPPERLQRRATMLRKMADAAEKAVEPLNKFYASLDDAQKERVQRVMMRRDLGLAAAVFGPSGGHMRGQAQGRWHRTNGDQDGASESHSNGNEQPAAPKDDGAQPSKP